MGWVNISLTAMPSVKPEKERKSQQIKSAIIKTLKEEKLSETTKDIWIVIDRDDKKLADKICIYEDIERRKIKWSF